MSQEVAAVTAAKYVKEVTVGGVTRYQACVHGCSSDVRDTHHEAVKDARRMLQSKPTTAVMKGDMPKLPAAVACDISGAWIVAKAVRERGEVIAVDYFAYPLHRSAKAIESWTGEDADEIIRGAMAGNVVRVESRGLAKPETRDLVAVIAPSSEAAVMTARVKIGSAEEKLIEEMAGRPSSSPLLASTVARLKADLEAVTNERDALSDAIDDACDEAEVPISDGLNGIINRLRAALSDVSRLEGERDALEDSRAMLTAANEALTAERDEERCAVVTLRGLIDDAITAAGITERTKSYDHDVRKLIKWIIDATPSEGITELRQELNYARNECGKIEHERDAFALTIARLVSKT